jgi:hypothetical protein
MNIEKGNNRTVTDYHIISIVYGASTIATTSLQPNRIRLIQDLQLKSIKGRAISDPAFLWFFSNQRVDDSRGKSINNTRK